MDIRRQNRAITYAAEKKLLDWLAARLYRYATANQLSALGLFGSMLAGASYIIAKYDLNFLHLCNFGIFLHWFGDSLDGRAAKLRHESRPKYGHYLDHILDAVSLAIILLCLNFSLLTLQAEWIFALVLSLLLMTHSFLKAAVTGEFEMSVSRFGPTEARICLMIVNWIALFTGNPIVLHKPFAFTALDILGIGTMSLAGVFLLVSISRALFGKNKIQED
ncbi:MAG TPA: CDP-alcohol phosphatidyltransferase family protein [bacterium]|nr:CDP-alcohol phosphatidyltransferase family protein [bacterium]